MPEFLQHFLTAWLAGAPLFSGQPSTRLAMEFGFVEPVASLNETHVLALADIVPPIGLTWLSQMAPGSSMTWMIEFLTHRWSDWPAQGWRIEADLVAAGEGYTSQSGVLRAPDGTAVALSRQNMVVFG